MSRKGFPRPGSWTVSLSAFNPGEPERIERETTMEISQAGAGWVVSVRSGSEPPMSFDGCQAAEDSVIWERGNQFFILRPLGPGLEPKFLAGVWLKRTGRGDTPIGTWVAEEDTRPPDGSE